MRQYDFLILSLPNVILIHSQRKYTFILSRINQPPRSKTTSKGENSTITSRAALMKGPILNCVSDIIHPDAESLPASAGSEKPSLI
jgi:hypothetical protein